MAGVAPTSAPSLPLDPSILIHPLLTDTGRIDLTRRLGAEPQVTGGPVVPSPGPALVLARRTRDQLQDLITISVAPLRSDYLGLDASAVSRNRCM